MFVFHSEIFHVCLSNHRTATDCRLLFLLSLRTAVKSFFSRCVHAPVGRIWHHVTEQPFPVFMFPLGFSYSCSIHLDYSPVLILSFKIAAEMA